MNPLQLEVIDEAFGPTADLYKDVLGVKSNASSDQIQRAYFERRNELFELLAESEASPTQDSATANRRFEAERKMDAIVMSLRILGNSDLRARYDDIRGERVTAGGKSAEIPVKTTILTYSMDAGDIPMKPKSVLKKSTYHNSSFESGTAGPSELDSSPDRPGRSFFSFGNDENKRKSSKRKARRVSPDEARGRTETRKKKLQPPKTTMDESLISSVGPAESDMETASLESQKSFRTLETTLTTYEKNRGYFETIKDEVLGALDDTSQSFHQVFSVFTLRAEEIDAVAGRIHKAQRQMINSFSNKVPK